MTLLHSPAGPQWKTIGLKPRSGIALPLSALHSASSAGIGDFWDLLPLIDWCADVGFTIIQLLPLSDSGDDPSPYNVISSCALNPVFLRLEGLPPTTAPRVNYTSVLQKKLAHARILYSRVGKKTLASKKFARFAADRPWLHPYALFKAKRSNDDANIHLFLQYLAADQLSYVHTYAQNRGVLLQGDLPILVSQESADIATAPELFDLELGAGAPPDPYNSEGQAWRLPIFNWPAMKKTGFAWWKERLHALSPYFDLYRIDHVVGLFRLWAIPPGRPSDEGRFVPSDPSLWLLQGKELLDLFLHTSPLLPIAEDLGTVPPTVRTLLHDLGICTTKVIRWERDYHDHGAFLPFSSYPEASVTCLSTHDSETFSQWWRDRPAEATPLANTLGFPYTSTLTHDQRLQLLRTAHHTSSLFHIDLLQEFLALYPELVHPRLDDERINVPGTVSPTNWTYRIRPSIEELTCHRGLRADIKIILN